MTMLPFLAFALTQDSAPPYREATLKDASAVFAMVRGQILQERSSADISFEALMTRIGGGTAPAEDDASVAAEIVRVARDHAAHPGTAAEFDRKYSVVGNPRNVFPTVARRPGDADLAPRYRYAWEYRLLESFFVGEPGLFWQTVESVASFHDDASLPLLLGLFRATADAYHLHNTDAGQSIPFYLVGFVDFLSTRGFDATVESVEAADAAQVGVDVAPVLKLNATERIREALRSRVRDSRFSARWIAAFRAYGTDPTNRGKVSRLEEIFGKPILEFAARQAQMETGSQP